MRFIYLLLIALVFTACSHHKIRFSKVDQKQKVVEIDEISSLKKKSETIDHRSVAETQPETEEETYSTSTSPLEIDESMENSTPKNPFNLVENFPKTVEDSTQISSDEAEEIKQDALRAEKKGTWSLISSIASPLLLLATVIVFAFAVFGGGGLGTAIASIVLSVLTLTTLVLSYVLGISSLRSRYNTPRGRKFAIAGLVVISSFLGLLLINLLIGM